ncbi:DUF6596 domain-containing protein [Sphingobacterium spiritivorum]|uniref:DUF6596 domain-containing protein n=1 Tax=Sphingobacterium spiritivorum TaxID=258 RepID=UPI003DA6B213
MEALPKYALSWKWKIMSSKVLPEQETNYRALHGKLFSGLLYHFGTDYVTEIEDAIQNSFLKSLKTWKHSSIPNNKENWLFIVARNDVLDQIKEKQKRNNTIPVANSDEEAITDNDKDLRLQTMLFIASLESVSNQAKILFILKNIFGLNVTEISDSTLIRQEAIYKSINRTKNTLQQHFKHRTIDINSVRADHQTISVIEEILYAVFNIGFDSFNEKTGNIINEDLCIEAFSLIKLLFNQYPYDSTSNLLALFCFHTARIPARIDKGKLISFFKQNRNKWNKQLIDAGFHYLREPGVIHRFYLEAVIISKYMSIQPLTTTDWKAIVKLYEIMLQLSQSPIVKLNYCFCLSRIGKTKEALTLLTEIEHQLPKEHFYFSLVKAKLLKEAEPNESHDLLISAVHKINQKIRREYLLENELITL